MKRLRLSSRTKVTIPLSAESMNESMKRAAARLRRLHRIKGVNPNPDELKIELMERRKRRLGR